MNRLTRHFLFYAALFLSVARPASAQLRWIADAQFPHSPYSSLYNTLADDKPMIIAVGSYSSQAAQYLLASGALQDLCSNHGSSADAAPYSLRDLHIAFVDVRVFPGKEDYASARIPVIPINESDAILNSPGWDALYSILGTHLYLITPDHLVRPLKGKTASELYAEVQAWTSKIRPDMQPDVRLLEAEMVDQTAMVRVQNFSTSALKGVELQVLQNGKPIARVHYDKTIPSLEDALIKVALPQGSHTRLTLMATAKGDVHPYNNSWSGLLPVHGAAQATASLLR